MQKVNAVISLRSGKEVDTHMGEQQANELPSPAPSSLPPPCVDVNPVHRPTLLTPQVNGRHFMSLPVRVRRVGAEAVGEAPGVVRVGLVVLDVVHQVLERSKEVYRRISLSALIAPPPEALK